MKRWILLLITILTSFSILAKEREERLSEINNKIEEQQELIEKIIFEKQKDSTTKRDYSNKLDWSKKRLKQLKNQKKKYSQELDNNLEELSKTKSSLTDYEKKCIQNIEHLLTLETYKKVYKKENPDQKYLYKLLEITNHEILSLTKRKQKLISEKGHYTSQIKFIDNNKKREKKNTSWAKNRINYYSKKIKKNENLENQHNLTLNNLKLKAKAMQELISKLNIIENSREYSYKFSTEKLIWPASGTVVRNYGEQKFTNKTSIRNTGIDIETETNSKIVAIEEGVVAFSKWEDGIGKIVIIDHQNGFISSYSYPSKLLTLKGEKVHKNQTIAISGDKTKEKSIIHFELRKDGHPVNPMDYLR
ncbi:MAG: M23 family metallopeptidase [Candidatus Cloacimonadota bacterium]|nr:M23 family metallopeptidase [Candidatus Cloacimonadota bacterium]